MIRTLPRVPLRAIDAAHEAFPSVRWPGSPPDEPFGGPLASRRVRPGYLFATGCERSGTTVLTRLLQSHPSVAIGMERYKYLLRDVRTRRVTRRLCPSHFEPGRFFDFRPSDTNIIPPNFGDYYDESARRYRSDELRYVGDKVLPPSTKVFRLMADRFPTARYVFIYRDAVAVASSFEVRARDPDDVWPAEHGYEFGIERWSNAFRAADWLIADVGAEPVFVVRYEDLFSGGTDAAAALFAFLELDLAPSVVRFLRSRTRGWDERRERPSVLDAAQQARVRAAVDRQAVHRFEARADWRLART
jgi:hypothetical protein